MIFGNFRPSVAAWPRTAINVRLNITLARAADPPKAMCFRKRSLSSSLQTRLFGRLAMARATTAFAICSRSDPDSVALAPISTACDGELVSVYAPRHGLHVGRHLAQKPR